MRQSENVGCDQYAPKTQLALFFFPSGPTGKSYPKFRGRIKANKLKLTQDKMKVLSVASNSASRDGISPTLARFPIPKGASLQSGDTAKNGTAFGSSDSSS